jgi:hypothetical protein
MPNPIPTTNDSLQRASNASTQIADSAYEAKLRAMPSYELKAEYLTLLGKHWDDLPRPKLESAIKALLQHRLNGQAPK